MQVFFQCNGDSLCGDLVIAIEGHCNKHQIFDKSVIGLQESWDENAGFMCNKNGRKWNGKEEIKKAYIYVGF